MNLKEIWAWLNAPRNRVPVGAGATLLIILSLATVLSRCSDEPPPVAPTIIVTTGDPDQDGAIANAQLTLPRFLDHLQSPRPTDSEFAVKRLMKEGDQVEHVWMSFVTYKDGVFSGRVTTEPLHLKSIKMGDRMDLPEAELADWMFLDNGKMRGNFTLRARIAKMPEPQAAALRAQLFAEDAASP